MAEKSSEIQCEENSIKIKTIFSKDKKYRYYLKKTWGKGGRNIAFLMYNPSKADSLKSDNTVNNATNYAIDRKFDSITIVNLFAYMDTNKENFKNRDNNLEALNDTYILKALTECEEFVIAWERGVQKKRKREVTKLLERYPEKLRCFVKYDEKGMISRKVNHLRVVEKDWKYEKWALTDLELEFS